MSRGGSGCNQSGGIGVKSMASVEPFGLAASEPGAFVSVLASRAMAYLSLTKPRLVVLVLATVAAGFFLGARWEFRPVAVMSLAATLVGTALVAGGAGALNQWLERDRDALMRRTAGRALPSGRIAARHALLFGGLLVAGGTGVLLLGAGLTGGAGRISDSGPLCVRLYAAENANDAQYAGRRDSGCVAAADRLGGGGRAARPRSLDAVSDRVSLAVPALSWRLPGFIGRITGAPDFAC